MADLALRRIATPRQTLGVLSVVATEGSTRWEQAQYATSELMWAHNDRHVSCIPPGWGETAVYKWKRHDSPTHGECIWIPDVPGRSEILIHAGNFLSDTEGCVLVGQEFSDLNGDGITDVARSRDALEELLDYVGDEGELSISWIEGAEPADLDQASAEVDEVPVSL